MILGIGNPVYDLIVTAYVRTDGRVLSGCSTNACLALAALGHQTTLMGMVGEDRYEQFIADMERYGIGHIVGRCAETGGFQLIYDESGDRTLDVLGIADPIGPVEELPADCEAVIFGPILGECGADQMRAVAQQSDALRVLDVQGLMREMEGKRILRIAGPAVDEGISLSHIAKPNEHEARIITGIDPRQEPKRCVCEIHARGCMIAVVTLAEAGSLIFDGDTYLEIPPYPTLARDSTGAGDTYMAGFTHAYLKEGGGSLDHVGRWGSAVSSVMIEHTGPDFGLTTQEAERRVAVIS